MKSIKSKIMGVFGEELTEMFLSSIKDTIAEKIKKIKQIVVRSILSLVVLICGIIYIFSGLTRFLEIEIFSKLPAGVVPAIIGLILIFVAFSIRPKKSKD